jgi:hypothetical protein
VQIHVLAEDLIRAYLYIQVSSVRDQLEVIVAETMLTFFLQSKGHELVMAVLVTWLRVQRFVALSGRRRLACFFSSFAVIRDSIA